MQIPNDFQLNKLLFFKELKYSENTKNLFWYYYITFIYDIEMKSNKDLYDFSNDEIDEYKLVIKDKSQGTIKNSNMFINKYLKWYADYYRVDKKSFSLKIKSEQNDNWYISKKDFFELCNRIMKEKQSNSMTTLVPLVFARYGIFGNEYIYMRNTQWCDINFDNKKVAIRNENQAIVSYIPVDQDFINWLFKLKLNEKKFYKGKEIINQYVIKTQIEKNDIASYSSIQSKAHNVFRNSKEKRYRYIDLFNSALVDAIDELYNYNKLIDNYNISEALQKYYPEEILTKDRLHKIKRLYLQVRNQRSNDDIKDINELNKNRKTRCLRYSDYDVPNTIENNIVNINNVEAILIIDKNDFEYKVKIDLDSVNMIEKYIWYPNNTGEIITKVKKEKKYKILHLSNMVLGESEQYIVKYLNKDIFDCRKENLRVEIR